MAAVGVHCVLELYECPAGLLNDVAFLRGVIRSAAEASNSTLLHEVQHSFEPQGVTALGLLAESHISVHTWPEAGYAAADIFTCGTETRPEEACRHLVRALQARRYSLRTLPRGINAAEVQPAAEIKAGGGDRPTELATDPQEDAGCPVQKLARISG